MRCGKLYSEARGSDSSISEWSAGPGFTPHEEFMLRSAPTIAPSVSRLHQVPDISRKTLTALKDQIRINRGRARVLRIQAAEKEEDSNRSEQEEWRLSYQADELDVKLVKLCHQESCLNRKISNLRAEETRLSKKYCRLNWLLWKLLLIYNCMTTPEAN